jgi:hypothetical protein
LVLRAPGQRLVSALLFQGEVVNDGDDEMITLFCIHGPIEYIGPDGQVRFTETAETKTAKYADYCRQNNIAWHLLSIDYQA